MITTQKINDAQHNYRFGKSENFYQSILDKGKGLDKIIEFTDILLDSYWEKEESSGFLNYILLDIYSSDECVTNSRINECYLKFLRSLWSVEGYSDKYLGNVLKDIQRYLKKMKNNEPIFHFF